MNRRLYLWLVPFLIVGLSAVAIFLHTVGKHTSECRTKLSFDAASRFKSFEEIDEECAETNRQHFRFFRLW